MDLINRSSLITEKDLNREFFEAAHRTEEELSQSKFLEDDPREGGKTSHGFRHSLKHILLSPLYVCRVFNRNMTFCCHVVMPQIWQWVVRKWDRFSLFSSLKRLFPGVGLLGTAVKTLFSLRCRKPRNRQLQPLDSNNHVDILDPPPSKHTEDEAGFSSAYPTKEIVKRSFIQDIFVGCSIGAMSVPQGMSYALLAGLEYQYGLYNGVVHPLVYFFFGTCRHAITGVSAIENLMLGERLDVLLGHSSTPGQRINAAVALSLVSAFMYLLFRICRLSVIADLLADPVLSGFATASAFVIGTSQLKHVFGMSGIKSEWGVIKTVLYILRNIRDSHLPSLLCCVISLVFLIICKHLSRRFCKKFPIPGPMLLVIFGCLLSWCLKLNPNFGVKVVGAIPRGLPGFHVPHITWSSSSIGSLDAPAISDLFFQCLTLCPLYFIIHISIAKTIAMRQKYFLDYGQELVAFSACNLVGGLFQCYPTCTSVSRSSVAESLGARTHFHGLAAALVVLCTLVFLTGPLGFLPMPSLAAVVLFGVSKMAEFEVLHKLWRLQKTSWEATGDIGGGVSSPDLLLWVIAFATTIIFGASEGVIIAVAVSLIWVGRKLVRPEFVQLGRLAGTTIYRNKDRFPETEIDPGIILYRIDAPINFCNAGFLEREIRKAIVYHFATEEEINVDAEMRSSAPCLLQKPKIGLSRSQEVHHQVAAPRFFILDCSSVDALDITAISALARVEAFAAGRQVMLIFANWKGPQRDFLYKADFYRIVPPNRCFLSNHDAVRWCRALQVSLRLTLEPSPVGSTRIGSTDLQDSWEMDSHPQPLGRAIRFEDTWRTIEAREMAGTLVDDDNRPQVEVEWDGLSALAPNIRIVQEVTKDGPRGWMVTVNEEVNGSSPGRYPSSSSSVEQLMVHPPLPSSAGGGGKSSDGRKSSSRQSESR